MPARVLLVGLDGASQDDCERYGAGGALPTLTRLRAMRSVRRIVNYPGMGDGVFWPSAATGLRPEDHGRYFQFQFDRKTYEIRRRDDARDFACPAFWNRLADEGAAVAAIDWLRSPFQPVARGFVLDRWLDQDSAGHARSYPAFVAEEAVRRYGADPWGEGAWTLRLDGEPAYRSFLRQAVERIGRKVAFCVARLRAGEWDLFTPVFSELHDVAHYAWHLVDHGHARFDRRLAAEVGDPFAPVYKALDRAAAALIDAAGSSAKVLVLGGVGMTALVSCNKILDEILRRLDAGAMQGGGRLRSAYRRVAPFALRRALSPLVRRVLPRASRPELSRRRVFAVPHNENAGCVRFNVKGREAFGIVEPGRPLERLIDEVCAGLTELKNAATGRPIVEEIVRVRERHVGRHTDELPDLFVVWRRDAPIARVVSDRVGALDNPPSQRTGDHTSEGFLWVEEDASPDAARALMPHETAAFFLDAVRRAMAARAATPAR